MKQLYCKCLLVLTVMMVCYFKSDAQNLSISGTVMDAVDNASFPGVNVYVKDGKQGTVTDSNGNFKLSNLKPTDVLIFSYVGYLKKNIPVSQAKGGILRVDLSADASKLDEVVVIGYGEQKVSEITGSIGTIKSSQIDQFSGGSLNTSLQGKIAGMQVTSSSGEPGAGFNITLRGVSSINGANEPLFIIDGVPVNNETFTSAADNANFSPLNDINPSDIESIEVLKDAASASIYGARASNGVVLITTKQGKLVQPQINLTLNSSMVNITRTIGVLNGPQFRAAYTDAIVNSTGSYTNQVPLIDSLHPYYRNSIDWQNLIYDNTLQYKADLSIGGASKEKNVDYYISGSYRDLSPVVAGTGYTQATGAARINYNINKAIKGSTNLNVSNNDYKRQNTFLIGSYVGLFPVYNPYDPFTGNLVITYAGGRINPLATAEYGLNELNRTRYLLTQSFSVNILKGLDFRTRVSYDYSTTEARSNNPPILVLNSNAAPGGNYNPNSSTSFVNENFLTYKKTIAKSHNLDFLLGQSYQTFNYNSLSLSGINQLDNTIISVGSFATLSRFSESKSENSLVSYFGRANYNFKSKYIFSAILRADGSSKFGEKNKFGYFPSVSSAWRFSKENYFANHAKWLYDGKLRLGYGVTGNSNIGNYSRQGVYSKIGSYGGSIAILHSGLANENLQWEISKQLDAGVDLGFLKGRISLTADYYTKNSDKLLFNVLIPSQSGYSSVPYNFGSLANQGFDFALTGILSQKAVSWSSTLTFSFNKNKVTSLPDNEDYRPNESSIARVGQPAGIFFGFKALGVYASDADNVYKTNPDGSVIPYRKGAANGPVYKGGDMIFEDVNGDGVIGLEDQQIIGNPTPKFFGGVQNSLKYKDFNLSVFINYVIGNDIYNALRRNVDRGIFDTNYTTDVLRRWRKQGDVTDVPKLIKGDPMENNAISSHFIEDGSFIRLQNVTLGYNLPKKLISRVGFKSANFALSAQNLLTFSQYEGYDPEVSAGSNALAFGVDNGTFPRTTSYNVTLNLKF